MSAFTALQTNLDKMLNTENNKFKEKFYQVIKFILVNIMLPLALSFVYDLGIAKLGEVIKVSDNENTPVIYEIQNENTYVNIVDQTDKQYHVYFIDDEGCAIYVGANARSV